MSVNYVISAGLSIAMTGGKPIVERWIMFVHKFYRVNLTIIVSIFGQLELWPTKC